jgi:hypothetical protein
MTADEAVRKQVIKLLDGGMAHLKLHDELRSFPFTHAGKKLEGAPYTAWQLLEHIRIAQWDILEFSRDANHESPSWPDGYWPEHEAPQGRAEWDSAVERTLSDLEEMKALLRNPVVDLHARIPWGEGQTLLREGLLVADHNAYHLGQLVMLRRMLAD